MGVETPCWLRLTGVINTATTAVVAYIIRAWRLYLFYTLQTRKMDTQVPAHASLTIKESTSHLPLAPQRLKSVSSSADETATEREYSKSETQSNVEYAAYVALYRAANTGIYRYCTDRNFFLLTMLISLCAIVAEWIPFALTTSLTSLYDVSRGNPCPSINGQRMVLLGLFGKFMHPLNDHPFVHNYIRIMVK